MGEKLKKLVPEEVFSYFEILSSIPRGSGHEEQVSDWFVEFAKARGLEYYQDPQFYNILIKKPGTKGYEDAPPVILHGHMDMVCKKELGVSHDFLSEGLELKIEDGYIRARGTTLGADNGIGLAYFLAVLDSNDIPHPPLEAAFTVMEEMGKVGGENYKTQMLTGKRMIDLNWHKDNYILAGCAGDVSAEYVVPVLWEKAEDKRFYTLSIHSLYGGHCEFDIVLERANSIKLAARFLNNLLKETGIKIADISGGVQNNVIPAEAVIVLAVEEGEIELVKQIVETTSKEVKDEYRITDPNIVIELNEADKDYEYVFSCKTAGILTKSLLLIPNGVISMSYKIKGISECSNNIGLMTTKDNEVKIVSTITSSVTSRKHEVLKQIIALAELAGSGVKGYQIGTDAPEWDYNPESYMLAKAKEAYRDVTGEEAQIEVMPASLELGLFQNRIDGLDIISIGTETHGVHTPKEELKIESVGKVWKIFKRLLESLR